MVLIKSCFKNKYYFWMKRLVLLKMKMIDFFENEKDKNIEMKWMRNL